MTTARFRQLNLQGSPAETGWRHGKELAGEIGRVLDFYRGVFDLAEHELLELGSRYAEVISQFRADYATEIEAIALAAGQDARLIYALNSRSEIYNQAAVAECTSVINTHDAVMAQNWDWAETLEPLVTDVHINRPDGHRIRMLTEPGIIGKIGMNSAGLGACLNILKVEEDLHGLPVHVLLRAILDCSTIEEAESLLVQQSRGKASHVLVGDRNGACISVEFAGTRSYRLQPEAGLLLHTNHYLADDSLNQSELYPSTHERIRKAKELIGKDSGRDGIFSMLADRSEAELSICKPYTASETRGFGRVGSVFTVLMDLARGDMHIRIPSRGAGEFHRVSV